MGTSKSQQFLAQKSQMYHFGEGIRKALPILFIPQQFLMSLQSPQTNTCTLVLSYRKGSPVTPLFSVGWFVPVPRPVFVSSCLVVWSDQEELHDLFSRAPPALLSRGADQVQESHTGVAKSSLSTEPHKLEVFLWGVTKLLLFFLNRWLDEGRSANMLQDKGV